jgi:1-deoxy-D-xylulose-5-phosphate reductoisomerase
MKTQRSRKNLLLQGATGSIGRSTLAVVRKHASQFRIIGLSAHSNSEELLGLAEEFKVQSVALTDESRAEDFRVAARRLGIDRIHSGAEAAAEQAAALDYDLLVNAMVGGAGIEPTLKALQRGISVALANKETLVAAGRIVMRVARENKARVIPIDSEHSAIMQCLMGEQNESVRRIWLTTSGGPFLKRSSNELAKVGVQEALAHPTWKMGPKISIDSATLFNKGLEVIEAACLFDLPVDQIEVVVHRQSVVHSMVEFCDGSIKAQMSTPDMRLPILFALSYPERIQSEIVQTRIPELHALTFEEVPKGNFPCLELAYEALRMGGTAPAALSAADEVAVQAFLNGSIEFSEIVRVLNEVLNLWQYESDEALETVMNADRRARAMATEYVLRLSSKHKAVSCC